MKRLGLLERPQAEPWLEVPAAPDRRRARTRATAGLDLPRRAVLVMAALVVETALLLALDWPGAGLGFEALPGPLPAPSQLPAPEPLPGPEPLASYEPA
jgi:hypothetical protein